MFLKLLKSSRISKPAGKNITSYSMKTLMFWCMEEKSEEFWKSSNLVHCICFCISKFKTFVEKGFLPNYFITNRNQFNSNEFTREIQTKTKQSLEAFLEDPVSGIRLLLSTYQMYENTPLSTLTIINEEMFIEEWLRIRVAMANQFHVTSVHSFLNLYDGHNISNIYLRCTEVLDKLTSISYAQPYKKLLQNCIVVQQYILMKKRKESSGLIESSDTKNEYLRGMISSVTDLTHSSLRIATCCLDDGVKDECLKIIRTVTANQGNHLFMQNYSQYVKQILNRTFERFRNLSRIAKIHEIAISNRIIEQDLIIQDPYKTIEELEHFKKEGYEISVCNVFTLVWERCWFDVTFMTAELPVLPKPAALELCIDYSQKKISFQPFFYGLLLEFLWHAKNGSPNRDRESVLEKMNNCVSIIPTEQKSRGLNFITYCSCLQKDYCSASRHLIESFKLNPVKHNVAYLYIKYIINLLRTISSNHDHCMFF
ncbi:unnamed protein product [Mytilus edulis]|uniref:Mab-21-like HhH/H2TH-like domain-containing protein n=1 Tax=Mytilus edulis TaxID=6550 RepID=A0A8S3QGP3_MYTED|nr:unnamed protein product [Mytilus edulis]